MISIKEIEESLLDVTTQVEFVLGSESDDKPFGYSNITLKHKPIYSWYLSTLGFNTDNLSAVGIPHIITKRYSHLEYKLNKLIYIGRTDSGSSSLSNCFLSNLLQALNK